MGGEGRGTLVAIKSLNLSLTNFLWREGEMEFCRLKDSTEKKSVFSKLLQTIPKKMLVT